MVNIDFHSMNIINIIAVFFLSLATELVASGYSFAVVRNDRRMALLCTAGIALFKGLIIVSIVRNPQTIIITVAGGLFGTWLLFRFFGKRL